jgi:RNA polymerase sigma-70 factor (ECF subfamily)
MDAFARELESAVEPPVEVQQTVCACVRSLAETLNVEYADSLRRIDVDGMSLQVYAAEIGIEPNNAAVRVHRARETLRKRVRIMRYVRRARLPGLQLRHELRAQRPPVLTSAFCA